MKPAALSPLDKAIMMLGGQEAVARVLKVTQPAVSYWVRITKKIPAKHAAKLERATKGQITRQQLRPDVFGKSG